MLLSASLAAMDLAKLNAIKAVRGSAVAVVKDLVEERVNTHVRVVVGVNLTDDVH